MTEEDEAKRAARLARDSAAQRKRREALRKAGICITCGGIHGSPGETDAYKGRCLHCSEYIRRRKLLQTIAESPPAGDRPKKGWRRKVSVRVCRHCKSRNLLPNGPQFCPVGEPGRKRERYLCLSCEKWSYGKALPPGPEHPCPYCKGLCRLAGRRLSGGQIYKCRTCGRINTDLFPSARRERLGSFRRLVYFLFGPLGGKALTKYCNYHCMSASKALRTILQEAAVPIVPVMATAQHAWPVGSRRQMSHVRLRNTEPSREPLRGLPLQLPDIRSAVARARMQSPTGNRHRPVAAEFRIAAKLDALAWEGLIRTMRWRGVTHQEAMRQLVVEAWRRLEEAGR